MRTGWRRFLPLLYVLPGCSEATEEVQRPEPQHVYSPVARSSEGEVILGATFSGGGAGDTTYRLLACPTAASSCEVLASIDWTYEGFTPDEARRPKVIAEGDRIVLVIGPADGIHGFKNFSRTMPSLNREGVIYLRYREPS